MTTLSLGTAYLELAPSTRGLVPAIRKAMGEAGSAARSAGDKAGAEYGGGFADRARSALGSVMSGIGMGVGMKLVDGVGGALKSIGDIAIGSGIDRALNIAGAEKKLEGLGHSAETVEKIMSNALGAVRGTAFGMGDAAAVAASAVAAGVEPGRDLERTLRLAGDAASIAGTDIGSMGAIFNKVAASNKMQMDVVNQLQDQGVPILQLVAAEMGTTAEETAALASKGVIGFDIFRDAIEQGMGGGRQAMELLAEQSGKTFEEIWMDVREGRIPLEEWDAALAEVGGAAQKSGETFEGAFANAKAALGRVGAAFATPVLVALTKGFQGVIPAIDAIGEKMGPLAEKFGGWVEGVMPKVEAGLKRLPDLFVTVGDKIGWLVQGAKSTWKLLFEGDVDGGLFGMGEDHPVVGLLLGLREHFLSISDWVTGTGVPALSMLWGGLRDNLGPVIENVGQFIGDTFIPIMSGLSRLWLSVAGPALQTVVGIITRNVLPAFRGITEFLRDKVGPAIRWAWEEVALPAFRQVAGFVTDRVLPTLTTIADFITQKVAPVVADFADRVLIPAFKAIAGIVKWAWDTVLWPVLNGVWDIITNVVGPAIGWLWENVFSPTFRKIGDIVDWFGRNWATVWGNIQRAAASPANFVIDVVWNNGLRKLLNMIPGVNVGDPIPLISVPAAVTASSAAGGGRPLAAYQSGGYVDLPWSASRRDPYLGVTRTGSMFRFEGEEFIVNRDATRRHRSLLEAINNGTWDELPMHRSGGLVSLRGHRFTSVFRDAILAAEALAGRAFRISQGGFRPRTPWSGTSHRGDAVDLTPITNGIIRALRISGIAAWDRTGKGNWSPHIHGVPLPGYGRPLGSAIWQAQDYLRGGDGLGGRDTGPRVNAATRAALAAGEYDDDMSDGLIDAVVRTWEKVTTGLKDLTGPWGELFKTGIESAMGKVLDTTISKLGGAAAALFSAGGVRRGYAAGTLSAEPGPAWVGEHGPELVDFRGGERVYSARESAAMTRPIHIGTIALPGITTLQQLQEFLDGLSDARRISHMMGG